MGLEYRGSRVSENEDIIRLLDARATALEVTDPADAQAVIDAGIAPLANKTYVDSAFNNRATQTDVNNAYDNRALKTSLGQSILQLDGNGKIPNSALPNLTTRNAVWVKGGTITQRLDIGTTPSTLASVWVNYAWMGNQPYHVLPYAQIEVKGNFAASNPQIQLTTLAGHTTQSLARGHGIPGWMDYYHLTMLPTGPHVQAGYAWNSSGWYYLTCRSFGASSDFTSYMSDWGLLLVPANA